MKQNTFAIEKDDLSIYKVAELKGMVTFVDHAGELVSEVVGWCDESTLPDLEEAVNTELVAMEEVLRRIGRRLCGELGRRRTCADGQTTTKSTPDSELKTKEERQ